jgi:hypothetical protein
MKVVDLQKRRDSKQIVFLTNIKSTSTYHTKLGCPRLSGAINIFSLSLAEIKEINPLVKECKSCGV